MQEGNDNSIIDDENVSTNSNTKLRFSQISFAFCIGPQDSLYAEQEITEMFYRLYLSLKFKASYIAGISLPSRAATWNFSMLPKQPTIKKIKIVTINNIQAQEWSYHQKNRNHLVNLNECQPNISRIYFLKRDFAKKKKFFLLQLCTALL